MGPIEVFVPYRPECGPDYGAARIGLSSGHQVS
jgi:hypothetical protein